ncbi:MAG: hypothetical protein WB766_09975 [Roseiarcus sp.]
MLSKPAATFSNPAASKSKPKTTKSKLDATKSKWLFLPRFDPFQRFTQMFPAFLASSLLRRVVDPAFGPRAADGHSHSTDSIFRKENAAQ